jgi:histidinol phosphatase-like PHP family hydrolase
MDFHSHTRFSDGEHELAEWVVLAARRGYSVLGVTDHVNARSVEERVRMLVDAVAALPAIPDAPHVLPGCEITRVPPAAIAEVVARARAAGAKLVLVHGETALDSQEAGTNRAAIEAGVDILAHPGLVASEDVARARERGVLLEISGRKVHSLTNGHVWARAREEGARVVIDSDSHAATDLFTHERHYLVGRGAGMTGEEYAAAVGAARELAERLIGASLV